MSLVWDAVCREESSVLSMQTRPRLSTTLARNMLSAGLRSMQVVQIALTQLSTHLHLPLQHVMLGSSPLKCFRPFISPAPEGMPYEHRECNNVTSAIRCVSPQRHRHAHADCWHNIKPITSGHSLCLIYNLVQKEGTAAVQAPLNYHRPKVEQLMEAVRQWHEDKEGPEKLILQLQHKYELHAKGTPVYYGQEAAQLMNLVMQWNENRKGPEEFHLQLQHMWFCQLDMMAHCISQVHPAT